MSTHTHREALAAVTALRTVCAAMQTAAAYEHVHAETLAYRIRLSVLATRYGTTPSVVSYILDQATGGTIDSVRNSTDAALDVAALVALEQLQKEYLRCHIDTTARVH